MKSRMRSVKELTGPILSLFDNAVLVREGSTAAILYKTGQLYVGGVTSSNVPEGPGIMLLPFGGFLLGEFRNGKVDGEAVLKEPNANFGLMTFKNGVLNGAATKFRWDKEETASEVYIEGRLRLRPQKARSFFNEENFSAEFAMIRQLEANFTKSMASCGTIRVMSNKEFTYFGSVWREQPEGVGFRLTRGFRIESGLFKEGQLSGFGRRIESNCNIVAGSFRAGKETGENCFFEFSRHAWFASGRGFNKVERVVLPSRHTFPVTDFDLKDLGTYNLEIKDHRRESLDENLLLFRAEALTSLKQSFFAFNNLFHPELLSQGFDDFVFNFFYPCSDGFVGSTAFELIKEPSRSSSRFTVPKKPASAQKSLPGDTASRPTAPYNLRNPFSNGKRHMQTLNPPNEAQTTENLQFRKSLQGSQRSNYFPTSTQKEGGKKTQGVFNLADYYLSQFNNIQGNRVDIKASLRHQTDAKPRQRAKIPSSALKLRDNTSPSIVKPGPPTLTSIGRPPPILETLFKIKTDKSVSAQPSGLEKVLQKPMEQFIDPSPIEYPPASQETDSVAPQPRESIPQRTPFENRRLLNALRNVQSMDALDRPHLYSPTQADRLLPKINVSKQKLSLNVQDDNEQRKSPPEIADNLQEAIPHPGYSFKFNEETINFTDQPSCNYNCRVGENPPDSSQMTDDIILTDRAEEGFMTYYKAVRDETKDVYVFEAAEQTDAFARSQKSAFFNLSQRIKTRNQH